MATDDEIRIVMNVLGTEKIEQARKAIQDEEEAIRQLAAALKAGSISEDEFRAKSIQVAQGIKAANDQIRAVSSQMQGSGIKATAILEFSRAVEDAQYGIAGVVNNVPGLVAALGGGAGLVGVISLAAIAVNQLVKHWDELTAALGQSKVLTEAEEMKKLGDETSRTADQEERYQKLKNREQRNQAQTGEADNRSTTAKNIDEAIRNAPVKDIDAAIQIMYGNEIKARIPKTVRDNLESSEKGLGWARGLVNSGQADPNFLPAYEQARDQAKEAYDKAQTESVRAKRLDITTIDGNGNASNLGTFLNDLARSPAKDLFSASQISKLRDSGKTPEDIEDEKAQEHFDRIERENANRKAQWEIQGQAEDDAQEKAAQAHLDATEAEYRQKKANWEYQAQQQRDGEDMQAQLGDRMNTYNKNWHDTHKGSQVFSSLSAFRDAIQTATRAPTDSPTMVENLAESRRQTELLKKISEQRFEQGPARAG